MALQFNPPDWIVKEYMNRPGPYEEANQGIQQALQSYMKLKELKKERAGQNELLALKRREDERQGREQFYNYGDVASLLQSDKAFLNPVQGPAAEGQTEPLQASYDPNNPAPHFNEFLKKYPQGIKGREKEKENLPIPLFNKKGVQIGTLPPNAKVIDDTQGRGLQFVGTQGGKTVLFDPNTGETRLGELPGGGGPIMPKVAPSIPGAEVAKIGELENMKKKMVVIKDNYDPSFVGLLDAPKQVVKQATGFGASKQAAYFRQATQDIKDSLLRARSGAQINENEYARLLPLVPNEYWSEVDFLAKSKRFEEVLDEIMSSKTAAFEAAGYRPMNTSAGIQQPSLPSDSNSDISGMSDDELRKIAGGR